MNDKLFGNAYGQNPGIPIKDFEKKGIIEETLLDDIEFNNIIDEMKNKDYPSIIIYDDGGNSKIAIHSLSKPSAIGLLEIFKKKLLDTL